MGLITIRKAVFSGYGFSSWLVLKCQGSATRFQRSLTDTQAQKPDHMKRRMEAGSRLANSLISEILNLQGFTGNSFACIKAICFTKHAGLSGSSLAIW